jgi:hypothetical protein
MTTTLTIDTEAGPVTITIIHDHPLEPGDIEAVLEALR